MRFIKIKTINIKKSMPLAWLLKDFLPIMRKKLSVFELITLPWVLWYSSSPITVLPYGNERFRILENKK